MMTFPENIRVVDLVAKVAGVSLRRTVCILEGIDEGDTHRQYTYGRDSLQRVGDAFRLVSECYGETPASLVLQGAKDAYGVVQYADPLQAMACTDAYRAMADRGLV